MELTIQNKLIKWFLQPLAGFMSRFSEKNKDILFVCAGVILFCSYFLGNAGFYGNMRYLYRYVFYCLIFGLMILSVMPAEVHPVRFDKVLFVPWCTVVLFMLIAGITKSVDFLTEAMLLMVAYPVFYIIGVDFKRILRLLFQIVRISFCIFIVVNLLFFPITQHQYSGFFNNVNGVCFFLVLVFCCCLVDLLAVEKIGLFYFLNLAFLGISAAFIYYTSSRSGGYAVILVLSFTVFLSIFTDKRFFFKTFLRYFLPVLLSIVVCIPTTLYVFRIPALVTQMVPQYSQTEPGSGQEEQEPDSPSVSDVMADIRGNHTARFSTEGKTLNNFSTRRIAIWRGYLEQIAFWGHSLDDHFFNPWTKGENSMAHMVILDFAYYFGIPAGLAYLAFNLTAGVKSIRYALRRPKDRYALAPFVISIGFGFISLFSDVMYSFNYLLTFYYYLVQCPLAPKMETIDK